MDVSGVGGGEQPYEPTWDKLSHALDSLVPVLAQLWPFCLEMGSRGRKEVSRTLGLLAASHGQCGSHVSPSAG